ncbi:PREDICTED: sequestosome-1 [Eufriesea mexicana]|uniref:sequestosome-1 n=1 Tax=Eufriesea mexicana TaxID=516756 RepID=UPI00083C173C|nr:PREDICTED: sequestosome-1 [Eufriesea mexicana]
MLFKVYLQNSDSTIKAIRQFTIDSPKQVKKKIRKMFLELSSYDDFTISWKDTSDDLIVASTEEELQYAFNGTKGALYIKVVSSKKKAGHHNEDTIHPGIKCDNCDDDIFGFRYKCLQCDDFDLCARCEARGKHWQHYMIRISQPAKKPYTCAFNEYLSEILKNNDVYYNKKIAPNECTSREIHCAISPWSAEISSEIYKSFLNNIIDAWMKEHIDPYFPKTEKGGNMSEEEKPIDNPENDKESVSDNASNTTQDESVTKAVTDEWTIIDKNDTAEVTQVCSISSNTNEAAEVNRACSTPSNVDETANQAWSTPSNVDETASHACSTSSDIDKTVEKKVPPSSWTPTTPEKSSSSESLYPQLPKEEKVIHHPNPVINDVVEAMIKMGFSNQGGLLSYLLEDENGDIDKVIEILQPKSG